MDVILGKNGYVWITRSIPALWRQQEEAAAGLSGGLLGPGAEDGAPLAETLQQLRQRHASTPLLASERGAVVRVRNSIAALARRSLLISPDSIMGVYANSQRLALQPKVCPPRFSLSLSFSSLLPFSIICRRFYTSRI